MTIAAQVKAPTLAAEFAALAGARKWEERMEALRGRIRAGRWAGQVALRRHLVELTLERLRRGRPPETAMERRLLELVVEALALYDRLGRGGRARAVAALKEGLSGANTLVGFFHLLHTAGVQRERGFKLAWAGFEDGASFDLLLTCDGTEVELVADVFSAEEGRGVHRAAWFRLVDRIDPDLEAWLAAHPGRYILKITLPQGLKGDGDKKLAALHRGIIALLAGERRTEDAESAVLRLDPLLLTESRAVELGLVSSLKRAFGPEAHFAVTAAGGGVFVMAARAEQEEPVAAALRHRLKALAPARLSGFRPGILAMLIDDATPEEWQGWRERLELEGEARQFLTLPEARSVVAVSCVSRLELLDQRAAERAPEGELRFCNPGHPGARLKALAPAVSSRS